MKMTKFNYANEMLNVSAPSKGVEIDISSDGKVIWVNVDGKCALRICKIPELHLGDELIEKAYGVYTKRRYIIDNDKG